MYSVLCFKEKKEDRTHANEIMELADGDLVIN